MESLRNIKLRDIIGGYALSLFCFVLVLVTLGDQVDLGWFDAVFFLVFVPLVGYHVTRLFFDE